MMLIELMPSVEEIAEPTGEAKPRRRLAIPRRKAAAKAEGDAPAAKKATKKTVAKKTAKATA